MKQQADLWRLERDFEVGDWVFVRLHLYKQLSLKSQGKNKLALFPPFRHLGGNVAKIFKPLGLSLEVSLESRMPPCSWLLHLGSTPNEAKGGRPYELLRLVT